METYFPELVPWFRFCYQQPAKLMCQGTVLPFGSSSGVQQGDPLGPSFFALSLRACCSRLKAERALLSVWYLDDGTLAGPCQDVLRGWEIIREEAAKIGLRVNLGKCELFAPQADLADLSSFPREFARCPSDGFDLLGSPIGSPAFCEAYVKKRVERIGKALSRLSLIDDPQIELLLMQSCLGFPTAPPPPPGFAPQPPPYPL